MIANELFCCLLPSDISIHTTWNNFHQLPSKNNRIHSIALKILLERVKTSNIHDLENLVLEYCQKNTRAIKAIESRHQDYINTLRSKIRKKYKKRLWRGHSYGWRLIVHMGYLLQCYHFAYGLEGKRINPSKAILAKEVGVCIRTLDKALKALKEMDFLTWVSGKKTWETNTYLINEAYRAKPLRRPADFRIPKVLWLKMQYLLKKKRFKELWGNIYEHILQDIADHILRIDNFLRTQLKKELEKSLKKSLDPPEKRKKPPNWYLLRPFNLSFKDKCVIGRYPEAVLRSVIDDVHYYENQGKKISSVIALLTSRCKNHQERLAIKDKAKTGDVKNWITDYLKANRKKLTFIESESDIDRQTKNQKPFIELKFHKSDITRSVLKVYQKVYGYWIDKIFTFDRPDFAQVVESYLERQFSQKRFQEFS